MLGPYRLQIRLTKPLGDLPARLTMPFFCPDPAEHARRSRRDPQPGRLGPVLHRRARRESAHRVEAKSVLPRADARPTSTRWCGRPGRASRHACSPSKRIGSTSAANRAPPEGRLARDWPGSTGSIAPAAGSSSPLRSRRRALAFNHDRPAFRGPGQIPLKKAINFAIDRPAMVRPFGYLGGKRTDQMLPPALARPASIYPLGGADVARRGAGTRGRASGRASSCSTRSALLHARRGRRDPRVQPQADRHRPRGEVLLDLASLAEKAATPGEPFDLVIARLGTSTMSTPATFLVPLLGRGRIRRGHQPRRPAPAAAHRCGEPPDG